VPVSSVPRSGVLSLISITALLVVLSLKVDAADATKIEVSGELRLSSRSYTLRLECQRRSGFSHPMTGHTTASAPCVLATFDLTLDGQSIPVPTSAFEDLANPSFLGGLGITEMGEGFSIHLEGGDGENSYRARFDFAKGRLVSRAVTTRDEEGGSRVQRLDFSP